MAKGMTADKVRNLTEEEIRQQERDLNDQLFRLKFQMKMGQTESLKRVRGLRKDIARIKTIARERVLGLEAGSGNGHGSATAAAPKAAKVAKAPHKAEPKAEHKTEPKSETKVQTKTGKKSEKKTATGRK